MKLINNELVRISYECGCSVSDIKTFVDWQKCGYIVKKGEKATKYYVLVVSENEKSKVTKEFTANMFCKCQVVLNPMNDKQN